MQSLNFEQIGLFLVGIVVIGGIGWKIKKIGEEQAEKTNKIMDNFEKSIGALNLSIADLQNTIKYINKDMERNSNDINENKRVILQVDKLLAIHDKMLARHDKDIENLSKKG